ncbi:MAG: hypothetical protein JWP66_1183 [Naasia sp.]|nr:hypothetical protein [Naasia sp.]
MLARRAFFFWQLAAIVVLPAWLLLGWAIWGSAGTFAAIALATPFLVLALIGVAGITYARKSVRSSRTVSWLDVGVAGAWHLAVVGVGFFSPATSVFAALAVALAIAAFWSAAWQLVTETRKRVKKVFEAIDRAGRPTGAVQPPMDAGEYIVISPSTPSPSNPAQRRP